MREETQEYTAVIRLNCDSGTDFEVVVRGRNDDHALDQAFDKGHQITGGEEDLEVVSISPTISPANKRIGDLEQQVADLNEKIDKLKAASGSLEEVEKQAYQDAVRFETSTYLGYDEMGSSVEMCARCRLPYRFDCRCS